MTKHLRTLRVLLADDNREMLRVVRSIVEAEFEVVGTVTDGRTLVKAEAELEPDIGIVDISMPIMNGISAASEIVKRGSHMRIIFLTVNEDADFVRAAFEAGGIGYVIKRQMATDLLKAIEHARAGRYYVSPGCELPDGIASLQLASI
jgi:DNA-binding NarL/FixJ family response regulator